MQIIVGLSLFTLLIPSYEMIKTFSPQERDGYGIIFSASSQHFVIDVTRRIMLQYRAYISAVKHYAAQRWENGNGSSLKGGCQPMAGDERQPF